MRALIVYLIFCLPRKKKKHLHQGAIQEDFAVFLDGK